MTQTPREPTPLSAPARNVALEEFSSPQYYTVRYTNPTDLLRALTSFVRSIVPGIVIAFFCQCIGALLSPTNRRHKVGGMRWGLVALTTVMFLSSTTALALNLDALFFGYVSRWTNRNSPTLPGPLGSWFSPGTSSIILANMISLNQWLADGLLVSSVSKSVVQAS